jgi:ATP-dependent protease ClpP protease subunit
MSKMEMKEFRIDTDFDDTLLSKFKAFISSITTVCILAFDIESYGGYCYVLGEMKKIIDAKKKEGFVILTNVDNYAYSAGFFFYLLGDIKYCAEDADFLFHPAGYDVNGRLIADDLRGMLEDAERFDILIKEIIDENTGVKPEALSFLIRNENFLSREDLIYLGFIEAEYKLI